MTAGEFHSRWPDHGSSADVVLLDVREPQELAMASIADTLHIPMAQIPGRLAEIDRNRIIVVMCHGGMRSLQVANFLAAQGYEKLINLDGGIDGWSREVDPTIPKY